MNITESELSAQYKRAKSKWPFIRQTELARGLPRMFVFAIGSRETNLTNEVGDFGHGHGVWQLDDRSHTPPGGFAQFDGNVPLQCSIAADMLHDLLTMEAGNVERAANRYNSGQPETALTTGHDYGPDVVQRMQTLQRLFPSDGSGNVPAWFTRDLGIASPFMQGSDVGVVQKKTGADPDGVFGPITRQHVVNFQSHHGLTADGIVGAITASVLGPLPGWKRTLPVTHNGALCKIGGKYAEQGYAAGRPKGRCGALRRRPRAGRRQPGPQGGGQRRRGRASRGYGALTWATRQA